MKSFLFNFLFTCFISTSLIAQDWNTITVFTPGQTFKDVYWVDASTAYAVSALYSGTALNMKKTSDGGVTWEEQYTGHTSMNYYEIDSPNNGQDVFAIGNYGILIHTNDGGANWHDINVGTTEHLRDIFFLSSSIGYIAGDDATVLKTTDGGMTWTDLNAALISVGTIGEILFLNEDRGFATGFNFAQETFDGGITWSYIDGFSPQPGELFQIQDIQFIDDKIGYMSGDEGLLFKTEDAGVTWINKQVTIPDHAVESLFSFKFLKNEPNIGFACGYHGLLIRTYDAGDSWELMTSDVDGTNTPDGGIFHSLDFYGNKGLMVGSSGQILEFEYISTPTTELDENLNLVTLFPNPIMDVLYFSGIDTAIDEIQVIDASGRILKRITNPTVNEIKCDDLTSGVYFLKMLSKGTTTTSLFIKN